MPDTQRSTPDAPPRFEWRRELALASLVGLAVVCVALWDAVFLGGGRTLGPWEEYARSSSLTVPATAGAPRDSVASDSLRQFVPWASFARGELAEGRFPLWCKENGAGMPLFANYQSALLSPFTLPLYLFPLKLGLLLSTGGKFFMAAASMLLFLRSLGRSRLAASFGAVAYGLAGFHLMCMLHPHIGVLALLPLGLLAVDRAVRAFTLAPERLPLAALAGLALALGVTALAGHPETLLFGVYLVATFAAYHVVRLAWRARSDSVQRRRVARLAFAVLAAGLAGGAIGAVQLMPFLEYLSNSAALAAGERYSGTTLGSYAMLQLFPDTSGLLFAGLGKNAGFVPIFDDSYMFFLGGATVWLAVGALMFFKRSVETPFFCVVGIGALLYGAEVPIAADLLGPLFGQGYVLASRAGPLWTVSACTIAALTIDALRSSTARGVPWRALLIVGAGFVALLAGRGAVERSWSELAAHDSQAFTAVAGTLQRRVDTFALLLVAAFLSVAALASIRRTSVRAAAWVVLLATTAAHSALGFDGVVRAADDRFVLPSDAAIHDLKRALGDERVVLMTPRGIQPQTNLFHEVALISSYDALEVRELDELRAELFGRTGYTSATVQASRFALDLFGVRYLAARSEWLALDDGPARDERGAAARWYVAAELGLPKQPKVTELDGGGGVSLQRFVATRDGLDGLVVHFLADSATAGARVSVELRDDSSGDSLARRSERIGDLRSFGADRRELVLRVPPIADSRERAFVVEARVEEHAGGAPVRLVNAGGGGKRFVLDVGYGQSAFERVGEFGDFVLQRLADSPGRAWIVSGAIGVADAESARLRTLAADFDPRVEAVIEGVASTPATAGEFALERTAEDSLSSSYRAKCDAPAWLVLAQTHYPGWRARVGGVEVPLLRANSAFCAVALPRGDSVVELDYEPTSVRVGCVVSLFGALAVALACVAHARGRRARRAANRSDSQGPD